MPKSPAFKLMTAIRQCLWSSTLILDRAFLPILVRSERPFSPYHSGRKIPPLFLICFSSLSFFFIYHTIKHLC